MGVESQMSEMVAQTEAEKGQHNSIIELVTSLTADSLENDAENPESLAYKAVKSKYPDILDRELLAGALDKHFVVPMTTEIDRLDKRHEAAIEQGHGPAGYTGLKLSKDEYYKVVKFLTTMNTAEDEATQEAYRVAAKEAELAHQAEINKQEAISKFEDYRILVPTEKSDTGNTELSLKEYLHAITLKLLREQFTKEEFETRIAHLKANFKFAIKPQLRSFVFDKYLAERKTAEDEANHWIREAIMHELEIEDQEKFDQAQHDFRVASIELELVYQLIRP